MKKRVLPGHLDNTIHWEIQQSRESWWWGGRWSPSPGLCLRLTHMRDRSWRRRLILTLWPCTTCALITNPPPSTCCPARFYFKGMISTVAILVSLRTSLSWKETYIPFHLHCAVYIVLPPNLVWNLEIMFTHLCFNFDFLLMNDFFYSCVLKILSK